MRFSYKKIKQLSIIASLPLLMLVGTVAAQSNMGDINGDGKVDIFDYNILLGNFGKTVVQASPSSSGMNMGSDSMAMMAWRVGGKNAPNPAYDKCDDGTDVVAAHNKFYVTTYDGKNYPTWHPPVATNPVTEGGKCFFGHEHGTGSQILEELQSGGQILWVVMQSQLNLLPD